MGAPVGNKNATKSKPWSDALRKEVAQDPELLRRIARKTCAMAEDGDLAAIQEIGNRLDGKAAQDLSVEHSGSIEHRGLPEIGSRVAELLGGRAEGDSPALLPH